jgi:hypothetical protein
MFLEAIALVNNIKADNARLLAASLVTSTPRVPFNYPRLPFSFWKGVRLYDSLSISSFHKFSRLCSISSYEPDRNLWGSHQEGMTRHSTVLLHVIRGRGFQAWSRGVFFQRPGSIVYWKPSREYLCIYKLANSKQLDIFHGHKDLHKTVLLLTPWSRVFLEKINCFQLVKKSPPF